MFGVIVCSRCNRVRGVELDARRTTCPGCGHSIDVTRARVYFRTEDLGELAEAVRQKAMEIAPTSNGKETMNWSLEVGKEPVERKLDENALLLAAVRLSERSGDFSLSDLMDECKIEDREKTSELLERMLHEGLIYEPEPGRYRAI